MPQIPLSEKVFHFARPLCTPGESIVVAVSGGSDSVALLFLLCELRKRLGIVEIVVAHLNHGLRGKESDGDEQLVIEHAGQLGVRIFSEHCSGLRGDAPGLEEKARELRYRFFNKIRTQTGYGIVATGHTLDDQAETVLMRLLRGSGLNGLRAIAPLREDKILRPLLVTRKQELIDWLADRNIVFRTDESNSDTRFFRNRVRHEMLPFLESCNPGSTVNIAAIAENAQEQMRSMQPVIASWMKRFFVEAPDGSFRISIAGLTDRGAASEALRQIFSAHGILPDRSHILELFENAYHTDAIFLLPGGWKYGLCRETVVFEREAPLFDINIPVPGSGSVPQTGVRLTITRETTLPATLKQGKSTVFIDGDGIGNSCRYRSIVPEDCFIPFGTTREVAMLKFLSKQGIPLMDRERIGCLFSEDNKPVWICGIRLDDRFRVGPTTKIVIKVQSLSIL